MAKRTESTSLNRGNWSFAQWLFEGGGRGDSFSQAVGSAQDPMCQFPACCFFFFSFLNLFDLTLFINKVLHSLMPISQTTGEIIDSNHCRSV